MLKIEKLTKKFQNNTAVNDVNFEIKPGEIFSLIGPNGSGKTTIIKIISGLIHADTGDVLIDGTNIVEYPMKCKGAIGYIPDEPTIWSAMTGEEFLYFSGSLFGVSEQELDERIPDLLKIFDLESIAERYFEDYSRGNKQKFSILAALLHKPKLLLIDEPIVGLDPTSAEIAETQFKKFTENGGSILLVTHTLNVAQKISHRIGVLKEGTLLTIGTMKELRQEAKLDDSSDLTQIYKALTK